MVDEAKVNIYSKRNNREEFHMFERKPVNEIVQIAAAGGGFRMDASKKLTNDLVMITSAASRHKAHIVFTGLKMRRVDEFVQIAAAGKGSVFFLRIF
jgi:hypothetical protein